MIGLQSIHVGPRIGPGIGGGSTGSGGIAGVTRDALSSVYSPASAGEWTILMSAAGVATGNPSAVYLMQEASGNLADSVGTFTLTAAGTGLLYAQAIAGWTRLGIGTTSGATGVFANVDIGLPNILTNSLAILVYAMPTTLGVVRDIAGGGAAATKICGQTSATSGFARVLSVGNNAAGSVSMSGTVHPWLVVCNRTASTATLYTDLEKISPTFGNTMAGQSITVGNFINGGSTCRYLYGAAFFNAAAEFSSAQAKTILTTLGWPGIPWS